MNREKAETASKLINIFGNLVKAAAKAKKSKSTDKPQSGGLAGVSSQPAKSSGCGACGSK
jgi:hypothetical protein